MLFVPGAAWLIMTVGWRWAFLVIGATLLAILVPLNLLHRPAPAIGTSSLSAATLRGALRTRVLWIICLAHLCMTVTMTMVNVHLVNFLVGTGHLEILGASTVFSPKFGKPRGADVFRPAGRPAERGRGISAWP